MKTEQPAMHRIEKAVDEAKDTRTFIFSGSLDAKPGQFVNVWLPGIDEKPFSVSYQDSERFGITVFSAGPFSRKLNSLKEGDMVGIRGPYGRGFTMGKCNAVLVGGGCGTAPLAFLANELRSMGTKVDFILGAKTIDHVMYVGRMKKAGAVMHIATDDGSCGSKGFATDLLESVITKRKRTGMIYTCGPEVMMKKAIDISDKHGIDCEASMERYMKCGFGICGQCCLDNTGLRVCKEGPVFSKSMLKQTFEFGKYRRDASGKKIPL
ncbi:MAG: dihydroorotate dehydrogenase electron transfer subunit [Candidatus Woesearchaeota archaeon]